MKLIEATTRYIREERGEEVRGTKGRKRRCRRGIHRHVSARKGRSIREHESQCVDGRSNVNCDPEARRGRTIQCSTTMAIEDNDIYRDDLVLSPCSVERRRHRILSGGCNDPGSAGQLVVGSDDDDVIVVSWVWVALGSQTDRPRAGVWGEAQGSADPPIGRV